MSLWIADHTKYEQVKGLRVYERSFRHYQLLNHESCIHDPTCPKEDSMLSNNSSYTVHQLGASWQGWTQIFKFLGCSSSGYTIVYLWWASILCRHATFNHRHTSICCDLWPVLGWCWVALGCAGLRWSCWWMADGWLSHWQWRLGVQPWSSDGCACNSKEGGVPFCCCCFPPSPCFNYLKFSP